MSLGWTHGLSATALRTTAAPAASSAARPPSECPTREVGMDPCASSTRSRAHPTSITGVVVESHPRCELRSR